jgi:hypothetical protein
MKPTYFNIMKMISPAHSGKIKISVSIIMILLSLTVKGQDPYNNPERISLGIHFDPLISWFGSDTKQIKSAGARPGFNFGITYNKYFTSNYSFSAGLSLINAGGRLSSGDTTVMEFSNFTSTVLPGKPVIYKIQYLSLPVGLKLQSNQIGYITFFTNLGLDPKVVIASKADIPSLGISGENAKKELRMFNIGYHITAGIEYSIGGTTALIAGLNFENNFMDVTKDINTQPDDKITHKILSFRLGINF